MRLILASQSPYRKQQLESLGLNFVARSPEVDEESLKSASMAPGEMAAFLARRKALSLKELFPGDWILGADQLVDFGGESLGKTPNFEKARAQLQRLQGRSHELVTSYCLIAPQTELTHTDRTRLHMRPLSEKQIESYLRQDEPYDCAGSYKLEKAGISLFEKIESRDFSAIQGLPLIAFSRDWLKISGTLPFETSAKESI